MIKNIKGILLIAALFLLNACQTVTEEPVIEQAPVSVKKIEPKVITYSAQPLKNPSKSDVIFAQSSLKTLGYPVGVVDGLWGKQSASAIRLFEQRHNLESANGQLSQLNLHTLQNTHQPIAKSVIQPEKKATIASLLNSTIVNKSTPELIIIEQSYSLMSKANPYSQEISKLSPGTGMYVLSLQNGWYEVETLSKQYGFIKEN